MKKILILALRLILQMRRASSSSESGVILPMVLILMLALTITGLAFLNAGVFEHLLVRREIAKSQAFYLAEAGIEKLWIKLNAGEAEPQIPWTNLGNGDYKVEGFYSEDPPYAMSTGQVIEREQEILKKVTVNIYKEGIPDLTLFGDDGVTMKSNAYTDSYDSAMGSYADTQSNEGDIGTNSTAASAISMDSNAVVNGNAGIGPGGDTDTAIVLESNSVITGEQLVASSEKELPLFDISDVPSLPDRGPFFLGGNDTDTISESGRYSSFELDSNAMATIDQDVTLYVEGDFMINSSGQLRLTGGVHVTLYVGGDVFVGANGIVNEGQVPSDFHLIGLDTCSTIELQSNVEFYGVIYAPTADIAIYSNGDLYGSAIGRTILMDSNAGFHYDKDLVNDLSLGWTIELRDWEELS